MARAEHPAVTAAFKLVTRPWTPTEHLMAALYASECDTTYLVLEPCGVFFLPGGPGLQLSLLATATAIEEAAQCPA